MHVVSKRDLNSAKLETMRTSKNPTTMITANGEVQTREEATVYVKELDFFVKVMLLEKILQFFHSESSAKMMGIPTTGPVVKNHISPIMAKRINCNEANYVDRTPTHNTHQCSTVCSQARNAQTTRLAQGPARPTNFFLRHKNTQLNRYNKSNSENTQYITYITKLPQSTSCAIKNDSGVKTCRGAETRAQQLPQVMSPRSLRPSQGSKLILEIHINYMMYMIKLEKKITELLSPRKWENLERLRQLASRILKFQRRPTFNRRSISTIPWRALQILTSQMESCKKC